MRYTKRGGRGGGLPPPPPEADEGEDGLPPPPDAGLRLPPPPALTEGEASEVGEEGGGPPRPESDGVVRGFPPLLPPLGPPPRLNAPPPPLPNKLVHNSIFPARQSRANNACICMLTKMKVQMRAFICNSDAATPLTPGGKGVMR